MTNLEAITLFTSGIRFTVLVMLIVVLVRSIKKTKDKTKDAVAELAKNPYAILAAVFILFFTSLVQITIEVYDHFVLK